MCNHYRAAISKLNLQHEVYGFEEFSHTKLDIFPDRMAPILRLHDGAPTWETARWGFPPPPHVSGAAPVTNTRNLTSAYWRPFLGPHHRCLVPFERFAEYEPAREDGGRRREVWFRVTDGRPAAFAGVWCDWQGRRGTKKEPVDGRHLLFSFLTCAPGDLVRPYHPKAQPVVLIGRQAMEHWLTAPAAEVPEVAQAVEDGEIELVGEEG